MVEKVVKIADLINERLALVDVIASLTTLGGTVIFINVRFQV